MGDEQKGLVYCCQAAVCEVAKRFLSISRCTGRCVDTTAMLANYYLSSCVVKIGWDATRSVIYWWLCSCENALIMLYHSVRVRVGLSQLV